MSFYDYSLPQQIIDNLYNVYNIKEPNEVQIKSFSAIKEGRDLILSSPTGTGKTLAYLLPLISTTDISFAYTFINIIEKFLSHLLLLLLLTPLSIHNRKEPVCEITCFVLLAHHRLY